jgi:small multidrug resistance family-3 protein
MVVTRPVPLTGQSLGGAWPRLMSAYGGVFVAGSLAWGMLLEGFRPDRYDLIGAALCLLGVAVIMYAPRGS